MPTAIRLHFRRDLFLEEEDFGAMIVNDRLWLPQNFEPICFSMKIDNSALFVALVRTDPREVARAIGWDVPKIMKALKGLRKMLAPYHGEPKD